MSDDANFIFKDGHVVESSEERWQGMATELGAALDSLLNRYTELVNCGDCGNWNPEEEMPVKRARQALERYRTL